MRSSQSARGACCRQLRQAAVVWLLTALATPAIAPASPPAFKIYLEHPGVYRVGWEDLEAVGLAGGQPSAGLGVSAGGEPVPVQIEDGGDGVFGPGDWIELVGRHLRGEGSYLNEHSRYNVYSLRFDHSRPARMASAGIPAPPDGGDSAAAHRFRHRRHLEQDLMMLRLPAKQGDEPDELWYWTKLVHNQRQAFVQQLDLHDLAAAGEVELRLHFRGWSKPRVKAGPEVADHSVRLSLAGTELTTAEWNGTEPFVLEVPAIDAGSLTRGDVALELAVPERPVGKDGATLIDVIMLNWIEVSYPRHAVVGEEQARFDLEDPSSARAIRLASRPDRTLFVYGAGGSRAALDPTPGGADAGAWFHMLPIAGESSFFATQREHLLSPEGVALDRPSRLAALDNQADYIIIAHRKLLAAIEPLAELHRSRGLTVTVADVEDVYDEFYHGISHPQALRSFLQHAYEQWSRPAPRFVLLVGDASWDAKNAHVVDSNYADWTYHPRESSRFIKNASTTYSQDAELNRRGLIPTWNHATSQGHSASDNRFVAFGEGYTPMMAIGRLPVVEASEVAKIVDKTIRYVTRPEVGPWRRNVLFITNESQGFQRQSDRVAGELVTAGYAPVRVYPASTETSNEHHTTRLVESFNDGQLFVQFLGHGGRYIWRTGPPDLKKNHDLFTLDHLDQLEPTGRLPVVMSLTCYSAPFDHPSADSIGEKLLRLDGRGAIAVFAASWRNSPSAQWGKVLFQELTKEGATVGEGILRAKCQIKNRLFVETYNLLGDPAVPIALPTGQIDLEVVQEEGILAVRGVVDLPEFSGDAVVDLVDENGEILGSSVLELTSGELSTELEPPPDQLTAIRTVRAYAWNQPRGIDALGAVEIAPLQTTSTDATETGATAIDTNTDTDTAPGDSQTGKEP